MLGARLPRKGLLLALNQMDAAYLAGSGRPLEIERTVSLPQNVDGAQAEVSYKDKKGKYQAQRGVTLPKI